MEGEAGGERVDSSADYADGADLGMVIMVEGKQLHARRYTIVGVAPVVRRILSCQKLSAKSV